jgi:hypothetical protein
MVGAHGDRLRRYSSDFARMYPKKIRLERPGMKRSAGEIGGGAIKQKKKGKGKGKERVKEEL